MSTTPGPGNWADNFARDRTQPLEPVDKRALDRQLGIDTSDAAFGLDFSDAAFGLDLDGIDAE